MSLTAQQAHQAFAEADLLHPPADVEAALDRMATEISATLSGSDPLVLCVMMGGMIPTAHLLSRFDFPLQIDYVHATRYRGNTRGADLQWKHKPETPLAGRVVLVIDDILDEGWTLDAILRYCEEQGASAVHSAVLVNKRHDRKCPVRADYTGVEVEDRYVFGYGMDFHGYLRNAPGIYAVRDGEHGHGPTEAS
ncbi:MAG: hypoxanthine-guanine phosphoribosyltransferase [Chromatiales bacterium 21-64-14]|nr:MAG: hypoxanthine-guanine phosphoribosyltransferase [Chromatiales bacterium 21-64-14]HQU16693.1 hypoxanthine-guanine phosphoribosyltransferase [Gammaproteobacteria bacterium]